MTKKNKYEDYKKRLGEINDPAQKLFGEILLDIRFVLNSIDMHLKGKNPGSEFKHTAKDTTA